MLEDQYYHLVKMYDGEDMIEEIKYSYGEELKDKKILLIITGSVAAFKIPELIRLLIRHGADVYVLPSKEALKYVTLDTLKWASGGRVLEGFTYRAEHIYLIREMDLIAVIPATANIVGKAANGIADTDASLAIHSGIGFGKPIIMSPVMHENMYRNPFFKDALDKLKKIGVDIIEPLFEEKKAKLRDLNYIKMRIINRLSEKILKGLRILVTAGPTLEYIDPVRIITNKSSGKMGVYIAEEAYLMGANVKLIAGNISVKPFEDIDTIYVETTEDMYKAVMDELTNGYDIFISASAPVDFRPSRSEDSKIESVKREKLDLELILTPKIVSTARERFKDLFIVSFKALYNVTDDELYEKALEHLRRYGFDMVVANDVGREDVGFQADENEVVIINSEGEKLYQGRDSKRNIARILLKLVNQEYPVK